MRLGGFIMGKQLDYHDILKSFASLVNLTSIFVRSDIENGGVRESTLHAYKYFIPDTYHNSFVSYIDNDESPLSAIMKLAGDYKNDLLTREAFLAQVSTNASFEDYPLLEREYQQKVETEYNELLKLIEIEISDKQDDKPAESVSLYGEQAFKVIENSVTKAKATIQKHRIEKLGEDKQDLITFLDTLLDSWRTAYFKRQPNKFSKAIAYLVNVIDKPQMVDGRPTTIIALSSALTQMGFYTSDTNYKQALIIEMFSAFRCDIKYTKDICTSSNIMDKRTFDKYLQDPEVSSVIQSICDDQDLTIPI